ncbi:hypothetical protein yc1106_04657 [Curvularia clavata]|uniref:Uncharacterized protein n=1 Tax=Curvularia clavata TaxID=95742 RepID=A0A9Q8ZAU7_CURCL|nr:hypothetical protein yc1106_04657 [Curvularia clavata]
MLSAPTPRPYATDITAARSSSTLDIPNQNASPARDTADSSLPSLPKAPTRHYTTLQEHADQILGTDALGQAGGATPRHTNRREGFSWGQQPDVGKRRHNQYAMAAEVQRPSSPPPLEEILKRTCIDDADDIQNQRIRHVDSIESQSPIGLHLFESLSTNESDYNPQTHRRSSLLAFAKGIARHVPDLRILHASDNKQDRPRRDSKEDCVPRLQKKDSSLSVESPPFLDSRKSQEQLSKPTVVVDEVPKGDEKSIKPPKCPSPAPSSGLRARRKVQLDLSMPNNMPDLPARGRHPVEMGGNLAEPRSRSPKTPWMHNEQPGYESGWIGKSSPIKEEGYINDDIGGLHNGSHSGGGLLPGNDILYSSQSPNFVRLQATVGDSSHVTPSIPKRSKSGHSNRSAASASNLGVVQIPGRDLTPAEESMKAQTKADLQQLAQDAKKSRSRWRRWRFTTSSDDAARSSGSEPGRYRSSINPFKRSNRLSDQAVLETSTKTVDPAHLTNHSKQDWYPSLSLVHIPAPPEFIPPGLSRIPTPPIYDTNGEVKGKLADFFFDLQSSDIMGHRKRPQPSPEGHWDSDALLMSQSTDLTNFGDEEEEEGPEGPIRNTIQPRQTFDKLGSSKPFARRSQGFQGIRPPLGPSLSTDSPMLGHDGWYRVNHEHGANLRDARTIAELARQEEEERRKFEWLVPEHLPNSLLCPLHEKYKGPSEGLCFWHGRRSGSEVRSGEYTRPEIWSGNGRGGDYMGVGSSEDSEAVVGRSPRVVTPVPREVKKRRLVSLSSP